MATAEVIMNIHTIDPYETIDPWGGILPEIGAITGEVSGISSDAGTCF